jgi:HEPN domain-containing protein
MIDISAFAVEQLIEQSLKAAFRHIIHQAPKICCKLTV